MPECVIVLYFLFQFLGFISPTKEAEPKTHLAPQCSSVTRTVTMLIPRLNLFRAEIYCYQHTREGYYYYLPKDPFPTSFLLRFSLGVVIRSPFPSSYSRKKPAADSSLAFCISHDLLRLSNFSEGSRSEDIFHVGNSSLSLVKVSPPARLVIPALMKITRSRPKNQHYLI